MIVNTKALLEAAPIKDMYTTKVRNFGVSSGLAEAGYDIRLKQDITFFRMYNQTHITVDGETSEFTNFTLASALEEFQMPANLVGIVHDKSTWARHGLSVFNTVIEPGWKGFLTLELVYHGRNGLHLPAGCGIAQVIFHKTTETAAYSGKYQNQADMPVAPIHQN